MNIFEKKMVAWLIIPMAMIVAYACSESKEKDEQSEAIHEDMQNMGDDGGHRTDHQHERHDELHGMQDRHTEDSLSAQDDHMH